MWDAELGGFSMANREAVKDARWWGGEPIWVTAERQGLATAPLFWPGSEAPIHGHLASEWRPWDDGKTDVAGRLAWVLERLARPAAERPRFLTFYTEVVDDAGHHNPNASVAVDSAITRADAAIGELVAGIERLGLRDVVDLVVVADHGMAETSPERTIYLDDLVPLDALRVIDWNPLLQAAPKAGVDVDDLVRRLRASPHLAVYRKSETPLDWHYRDAPRVPEILALADEGWSLTTHDYVAKHPLEAGGNHGYDRNLESMGALFVAAGPSFRQGVEIAPFENVDLYEMFCKILGLTPAPNDGQFERVRGALR
jgi:predicted AlkP superfamily pyrophosphatase or phosphodiesterase